jgi:hypothetical protein
MGQNYYVMLNELEKPRFDAYIEGALLNSEKDVIPIIFNRGRSLRSYHDQTFYVEADERYCKLGKFRDKLCITVNSTSPLFVVSEKAETLLREITYDQIEYFNFDILNYSRTIPNYKIGNIINRIDCIDYERSDLEFEFYDDVVPTGDIITTHKLVIDEGAVPKDVSVFLLDRYSEDVVVISQKLKDVIDHNNLSGFSLCKLEEFNK